MNGFDLSTITDLYKGSSRCSSIYIGNTLIWPTHNYSLDYLTIESLENNNTIYLINSAMDPRTISWSTDNSTWTDVTTSTDATSTLTTLNIGEKIYIKGSNNNYSSAPPYQTYFGSDGEFNVYGNIMSLIYGDNFIGQTTLPLDSYTFNSIFSRSKVVDASNLILPATTLADWCYMWMFEYCLSLTAAPALPATTLADSCYFGMFGNCISLTTAPELPATTLSSSCYDSMFSSCTSLTAAPELPATTLADYCYNSMFIGCTSLTTPPELPATTLANDCYAYMFKNCSSLTITPALPATTLADYCYRSMFEGCTSLTTAPELPATTLTGACYRDMFYNCTSLTTAPELPATALVTDCYKDMFKNCSSLNYIKCLATDISSSGCTNNWVSGVAATGTFTKDPNMTDWTTGASGIPSGWTVEDYNPQHDYSLDYFTIESLEDNNEIQFIKGRYAPTKTIEWSTDGTTWTISTSSTTPTVVTTLNTGDKIMIRGNNTQYASSGTGGYENRLISTKTINMYGNIMSLLYGDNFVGQTTLPAKYTFCRLFSAGKMVDTSNLILPATNTTEACYRSLLDNNTTLVYSPKILPALTLTKQCYNNMFNKASNLESSPILPALTLAQECYGGLFYECRKLGEITCLATNISASQCTNLWVYNIKATGTFTKNSSMSSWPRGQHGIPIGWTVVNVS